MESSPINTILNMKQQGMSNNQIIQALQREGYSNTQIFDAMNQADAKNAVEPVAGNQAMPGISNPVDDHHVLGTTYTDTEKHTIMDQSIDIKTEEMIEAIIDEKWEELLKDVNKIVEWKNRAETRLTAMEEQVKSIKDSFDQLHQGILSKVTEYDKHILDVGTELKAMEKVFSKVLPTFTENVHELSRITGKVKKEAEKNSE